MKNFRKIFKSIKYFTVNEAQPTYLDQLYISAYMVSHQVCRDSNDKSRRS